MAQVKDPVCGMTIDSTTAAGQARYKEETYYFCSPQCKRQFEANPTQYVGATTAGADRSADRKSDTR